MTERITVHFVFVHFIRYNIRHFYGNRFYRIFSVLFCPFTVLTMSPERNFFRKGALNCPTKGVPSNAGNFFCSQQVLFGEVLVCCLFINV